MRRQIQFISIMGALICTVVTFSGCTRLNSLVVTPLPNPAAPGSVTPNETATPDGNVLVNWIEPATDAMALRFAVRGTQDWSAPQTIVERKNFDKYAEAPPWVLILPNRSLLAVWSERLPLVKGNKWAGNYLYTAASSDQGKTWTQPTIVHSDRTNGEHSFASLAVRDDNHATIVWLDARDYETKHVYRLMSAVIASSGAVSDEQTVDDDVCTCCPTSLVKTSTGFVTAYRNHTSDEIRDIYTVREEAGKWQTGKSLHNDGWHINGCPVNGAALAQRENEIALAWYTGIEDKASLQVAFSNDGGATFPIVRTIDSAGGESQPIGRPAIAFLGQRYVLVTWLRRENGVSRLVAAQVRSQDSELHQIEIAQGTTESLGYPRMQLIGREVMVSWGGAGETKQVNTALLRAR
jgi:hypothetical protein